MAKIEKMLEMFSTRNVERAILIGDRPFQLYAGGRKVEGSLTPATQLREVLEEITPTQFLPSLNEGGAFHFRYPSPHGTFDIGVENFVGTLQVTITPAKAGTLAPKGPLYSTSQAEVTIVPTTPVIQPPAQDSPVSREMPAPPWAAPITLPSSSSTSSTTVSADSAPLDSTDSSPAQAIVIPATPPASDLAKPDSTKSVPLAQSNLGNLACTLHPDRAAAGVCAHSGKFYCSDDLVEVEGRLYGKENLSFVLSEARRTTPQVVINNSPQAIASPVVNTQFNAPPMPAPVMVASPQLSRLTAGLLGIFLGGLGIHRFYMGYHSIGWLQILVTVCTCGYGSIWGFIEGIVILCGGMKDAQGRPLV
ncbi:MAG TPA: TM2 domain-containing protein [Abditibacteriaceae bacterium]|jgi:TM2 domain-containing membrane protein YozV